MLSRTYLVIAQSLTKSFFFCPCWYHDVELRNILHKHLFMHRNIPFFQILALKIVCLVSKYVLMFNFCKHPSFLPNASIYIYITSITSKQFVRELLAGDVCHQFTNIYSSDEKEEGWETSESWERPKECLKTTQMMTLLLVITQTPRQMWIVAMVRYYPKIWWSLGSGPRFYISMQNFSLNIIKIY